MRQIRWLAGFVAALVIGTWGGSAQAMQQCTLDALNQTVPPNVVLDSVSTADNGTSHCQIDGHIITTNPGPDTVGIRLLLPLSHWNGRYILIAMGGNAGVMPDDPKMYTKADVDRLLGLGWAVAGTDTGHKAFEEFGKASKEFELFRDKAKLLDFHHRAIHVTSVATQDMTRKFYAARRKVYRYLYGCSGGGSAGLNSGLNYPGDYDGIVAGAPGLSSRFILGYAWAIKQTLKTPSDWISPAKLIHVEDAVMARCDISDGVKDDMIWDPRQCKFDPDELICKGADADTCLTPGQAQILKNILAGPSNAAGQIAEGREPSNMSAWPASLTGPFPPPWSDTDPNRNFFAYSYAAAFMKLFFGDQFEFDTQLDFNDPHLIDRWDATIKSRNNMVQAADLKPWMPDSWLLHGPKLILWNGFSDPNTPPRDTLTFWKRGFTESSSPKAYDAKTRLYMAPGVTHCGGGTGPTDVPQRLLDALTDWVELGKPPAAVVTHRVPNANVRPGQTVPNPAWRDLPSREFLLCPQPQRSVFVGQPGQEGSASAWTCKPAA